MGIVLKGANWLAEAAGSSCGFCKELGFRGMWLEQGESVRGGVLKGTPLESLPWEPASWCLKPPGEIMSAAISGGAATAGADSGGGNNTQTRLQDRRGKRGGWVGVQDFTVLGRLSSHPTLVTTVVPMSLTNHMLRKNHIRFHP